MIKEYQHFDLLQKIILERVILKPPFRFNASMHNEACFLYTIKGESKLLSPGDSVKINSNEGVVMKCGNYLQNWLQTNEADHCEAIAVHFYPEVLKRIYDKDFPEFLKQAESGGHVSVEKIKVDALISNYIESLLFYFENPSLVNEDLIILKVKELILLLIKTDSSNRIRAILQDLFNPDHFNFKEVIEAHLFENLSLDDFALLTSLSLSSFKRKFKEVFGSSPARYIKTKKLEKSAELLELSSQRISDIAFDCGFNDVAHFSKSFHIHFGVSPTDYRTNHQSLN